MANETMNAEPIVRKNVLDLDSRFFPSGIHPDSLTEIFGPSGSGKTFLVTYLLARFLTRYPDQTAILLDTRGHFSYSNLAAAVQYFDAEAKYEVKNKIDAFGFGTQFTANSILLKYFRRLIIRKCFCCDEFLDNFTPSFITPTEVPQRLFRPPQVSPKEPKPKRRCLSTTIPKSLIGNPRFAFDDESCSLGLINAVSASNENRVPSVIEDQLLLDPSTSVVFVDSIDAFSHSPRFYESERCRDITSFPNVMKLIKEATQSTKTPVICTLSEYLVPKVLVSEAKKQIPQPLSRLSILDMEIDEEEDVDSQLSQCSSNTTSNGPPSQNIVIEQRYFTHSITLTPLPVQAPPRNINEFVLKGRTSLKAGTIESESEVIFDHETKTYASSTGSSMQRECDDKKDQHVTPQFNFEAVAHYRSLGKGSGSDGPRTRFTIMNNMLFVRT